MKELSHLLPNTCKPKVRKTPNSQGLRNDTLLPLPYVSEDNKEYRDTENGQWRCYLCFVLVSESAVQVFGYDQLAGTPSHDCIAAGRLLLNTFINGRQSEHYSYNNSKDSQYESYIETRTSENDTFYWVVLSDKPFNSRALDSETIAHWHEKIITIQQKWSAQLIGLIYHLMSSSPEYIEVFERHSGRYYSSLVSKVRTHGLIGRNALKEHLGKYYQIQPFMHAVKKVETYNTQLDGKYLHKCGCLPAKVNGHVVLLTKSPDLVEQREPIIKALNLSRDSVQLILSDEYDEIKTQIRLSTIHEKFQQSTIENSNQVQQERESLEDEPDNTAATTSLVNRILEQAIQSNASDIHFAPSSSNTSKVKIRVDGVCLDLLSLDLQSHRSVVARLKVLAQLDITERRVPQDGKFSLKFNRKDIVFRLVSIPSLHGEGCVARIHRPQDFLSLQQLNMPEGVQARLEQLINRTSGLIIVTGPTGSGKTTTLHAMLRAIATDNKAIWTAEDPVEIVQDNMMQVNIRESINFGFSEALRTFLRADPDVILIGEMRDKTTAITATHAAMTGHLVFSTLHSNSAKDGITRLRNLGVESYNVIDAVKALIAQRLVRKLCSYCKAPLSPEKLGHTKRKTIVEYSGVQDETKWKLFEPTGCQECHFTGYRGRTGVYELLELTPQTANLLLNDSLNQAKLEHLDDTPSDHVLLHHAYQLVIEGVTSLEEVTPLS